MNETENKTTIGFEYTNEFGDTFHSKSTYTRYEGVSDPELMELGEYFNNFIRQIGFIRHNDMIFMEDVTEEEYDALVWFLKEYRQKETES